MKFQLIKIGKPAIAVRDLVEMYLTRIRGFTPCELVEWKDDSKENIHEKIALLKKPQDFLVLLDEQGKQWTSIEFSKQLRLWMDAPQNKMIYFIIGGPYGFSSETKKLASANLGLSHLTLQGDLAWLVFCEQLYRALTIQKGLPYHHV